MAGLAELRSIVGDAHAREAHDGDAIDGVRARWVAEPGSSEEVARLLSLARGAGWRVAPRGSGTKLGWGDPPRGLDLVVSTARLASVLEHTAGDLVASVEAGIRLEALQARLALANQMLALDPPCAGATVGGVIATNSSGPRRLRYGTVRDLLIGITVVLSDGTIAKAGGKVVKNVAGYDLGKLFTGSLGTLGVVTQATFRLHPQPPARRLVEVAVGDPAGAGEAALRLLGSTLVPSAIELDWPDEGERRIMVLFEGIEPGVEAQARTALSTLGSLGPVRVHLDDQVPERWRTIVARPWKPGGLGLKVSYLPAELSGLLSGIVEMAARGGPRPRARGSAGTGILYLGYPVTDRASAAAVVTGLRGRVKEGNVVVQEAPPEFKASLDVWGPIGSALDLMRRVKHQFDPGSMLNPGRFAGGI